MNEAWECRNCHRSGELDIHGRCPRCGSESVIPLANISYTGANEILHPYIGGVGGSLTPRR